MTNVNIMPKKILKPSKDKKFVRIDAKTFIEVDEDISDEAAIERFNENINVARNSSSNPYTKYRVKKDKSKPKRKRKARHVLEFGYTSTRDFKRAMLKDEVDQDDDMNTSNK